jgi:hypothetical protein
MNPTPGGGRSPAVTVAAYAVLFVFGAAQGLFGSFQYSRISPVLAIGLCVIILVTCVLAAWGMRSVSGAFTPALGWIIASYVLSMPVSNGSVIIASTTAGKWYLYGGTLSAVAAVVISFGGWFKAQPRRY